MFQTTARVPDLDDPELRAAATTGDLKNVTGHGELELPGGVFLQIALPRKVVTLRSSSARACLRPWLPPRSWVCIMPLTRGRLGCSRSGARSLATSE